MNRSELVADIRKLYYALGYRHIAENKTMGEIVFLPDWRLKEIRDVLAGAALLH